MAIRAEVLKKILEDAEEAKPIDGTRSTYNPEDYSKVIARQRALGALDDAQDGYLHPQIGEGEIEFDEHGNLKRIARTQPKVIDPRTLTANRYKKEVVKAGTPGLRAGTYILVVFGAAIVRALSENQTLTPQVRVHRFVYRKGEWQFVRTELIEDKQAYLMTSQLDAPSALKLMHLIEQNEIVADSDSGDSLDSILTASERKTTTEGQTDASENNS